MPYIDTVQDSLRRPSLFKLGNESIQTKVEQVKAPGKKGNTKRIWKYELRELVFWPQDQLFFLFDAGRDVVGAGEAGGSAVGRDQRSDQIASAVLRRSQRAAPARRRAAGADGAPDAAPARPQRAAAAPPAARLGHRPDQHVVPKSRLLPLHGRQPDVLQRRRDLPAVPAQRQVIPSSVCASFRHTLRKIFD